MGEVIPPEFTSTFHRRTTKRGQRNYYTCPSSTYLIQTVFFSPPPIVVPEVANKSQLGQKPPSHFYAAMRLLHISTPLLTTYVVSTSTDAFHGTLTYVLKDVTGDKDF